MRCPHDGAACSRATAIRTHGRAGRHTGETAVYHVARTHCASAILMSTSRIPPGLASHVASRFAEYRVVEVASPSTSAAYYFEVPVDGGRQLLRRIGPYAIYGPAE